MKFAVAERESAALAAWRGELGADDVLLTCELAVAEVLRAVSRVAGDLEVALAHLDALEQFRVDRDLLLVAGRLEPVGIRTLDAIHLAAAVAVGDELVGVVTYDERMADAARAIGLSPLAPGADGHAAASR